MMKLEVKKYVDDHYKNVNQFAVALGIGYQAACKIYNGETTKIAFDTLEKMCELFNCTPNDLLISTNQQKKNIIRIYHSQNQKNNKNNSDAYVSETNDELKEAIDKAIPNISQALYNIALEVFNSNKKDDDK